MMLGVGAIALSSATGKEQTRWKEAARREGERYDRRARLRGIAHGRTASRQ